MLYSWSYLQNCSSFLLQFFSSDTMDIASFVPSTTPTNDITMVNKFSGKLAHSFDKLSSRLLTSTYPNWFCISQVLDVTGIITKCSWTKLTTPHSNVMACRSKFSSLKCLLGSTTQPKAVVSCIPCKIPTGQN